jgi:hypothetical protein
MMLYRHPNHQSLLVLVLRVLMMMQLVEVSVQERVSYDVERNATAKVGHCGEIVMHLGLSVLVEYHYAVAQEIWEVGERPRSMFVAVRLRGLYLWMNYLGVRMLNRGERKLEQLEVPN